MRTAEQNRRSNAEGMPPHRLAILQFGDYAEAVHRFDSGRGETYRAQRFTVEYVGNLARTLEECAVICLGRDHSEERLRSGVRAFGLRLYAHDRKPRHGELIEILDRLGPTHVLLGSPLLPVLSWARKRKVCVLPLFMDSFESGGFRSRVKNLLLARALNRPEVRWVANHGLPAARNLVRIGVEPAKVLPFELPQLPVSERGPESDPVPGGLFRVLYVGRLEESKGVGDVVSALSRLAKRVTLKIVGAGDPAPYVRLAGELGLSDRVDFAGVMPHDRVLRDMAKHHAVVVPSRHEYPEGLPMTIYEAMCSGTPLVVSDHPMFTEKLVDGRDALVFPAGQVTELASKLRELSDDQDLWARLSRDMKSRAGDYLCPLQWQDLISRWLGGRREDEEWLSRFSLGSEI